MRISPIKSPIIIIGSFVSTLFLHETYVFISDITENVIIV
jgi:hypothetical protein